MSKNIWNVVKVNVGRMIQEIGHSFEARGSAYLNDPAYLEPYNRHRNVVPTNYTAPTLSENAFISENCTIYGHAFVDEHSSIWYGAV